MGDAITKTTNLSWTIDYTQVIDCMLELQTWLDMFCRLGLQA